MDHDHTESIDDNSEFLDDQDVPPDLGATLQATFGTDEPPTTLRDLVALVSRVLDESDHPIGVEDLCTANDSRHVARIDGDSWHYHCVLDTLFLPFLRPESTPVEIRSVSPTSDPGGDTDGGGDRDADGDGDRDADGDADGGDVVVITASRGEVSVTPPEAVMSVGLADGIELADPTDVDATLGYTEFCPYVNAFPSRATYEQWDRDTPGATTMAVSFPTGVALARELARQLGAADGG